MAQRTQDPYGTHDNGKSVWVGGKSYNDVAPLHNTGSTAWSRANTPNASLSKNNAGPHASIPTWGGSLNPNYGKSTGGGSGYSSGGSGGSGGGYGGGDWGYAQASVAPSFDPTAALMAALEAQRQAREQAVNAANAALEKQRGVAQSRYDASIAQLANDIQDLRNRASVQNFKAKRSLRESQADRGAFNSGLGMQENLGLNSRYTNNMNRIDTEERNSKTNMWNNLQNIFSQIDMQKAQNLASTLNNYTDQVSSLITALFSNYAPSANYNNMLASLGGAGTTGLNNIVSNTAAGLNSNTGLYDTLLRYGNY